MKEIIKLLVDSFNKAQKHLDDGTFDDLRLACAELIISNAEARQALNKMGWIDVNHESKPKDGEWVIVRQDPETTATRHALPAKYDENTKKFAAPNSTLDGIHLIIGYWSDVTHWMPLPSIDI